MHGKPGSAHYPFMQFLPGRRIFYYKYRFLFHTSPPTVPHLDL